MRASIFHISPVVTGIFIICSYVQSYGQADIFPVRYNQYFLNPGFLNPAIASPRGKFECLINSRILIGPFNNVRSSLAQGTLVMKRNESGPSRMAYIILQNESEGKFLDRTRAYGGYIVRAQLSSSISLNAASALGIFSYSIQSSNVSAGGSATTIDGKVGTYLHSENWSVGISVNQLFNNTIIPFSAPLHLKRFYSLYGNYKYSINQSDLTIYYQSDHAGNYFKANVNCILGLIDRVEFGGGYNWQEGVSFYGGLRKIEIQSKMLRLGLSFFVPMHNRLVTNRVAEFTLRLY